MPGYTTKEGIRRAYVRKAWQHHPDLHPDDSDAPETMSAINEAYETLSDPRRRAEYDAQRVTVRIHAPTAYATPSTAPLSRHRNGRQKEPNVLHTALAFFVRLFRSVATALPC